MDDHLATVLIVAGGAVTVLWVVSFMVSRWRAHRNLMARLHSTDPVERARVATQLLGHGRRASLRSVYVWVPTEPDARTRLAVAWSALRVRPRRRHGWAGRSLREWAELEVAQQEASPAEASSDLRSQSPSPEPRAEPSPDSRPQVDPVEPVEPAQGAPGPKSGPGREPEDVDPPPVDPIRWEPD